MNAALPAFDHLTLNARDDLPACCQHLDALGFALTPPSAQSIGAVNRCAILEGAYLEIIALDATAAQPRTELLGQPAGLNAMVMRTPDATACYQELVDRGLPALPVQQFSRMALDASGREREAGFRVVRFEPGWAARMLPFGRLYFCQHLTPELIFDPGFIRHRNGCRRFTGLNVEVRDLPSIANLMTLIFGTAWEAVAGAPGLAQGRLRTMGFDIVFSQGQADWIPSCDLSRAGGPSARELLDHRTPYGNFRF